MNATTRPDMLTEALCRYMATREPQAAEAERDAFEAGFRAGARAVIQSSGEMSQAARSLQHVLMLLGLIGED